MLNIPTKINKGNVEIITPVELIKKGYKVGSSEAALASGLSLMVLLLSLSTRMVRCSAQRFLI